jgi:hypothetical protein
MDKPGVTRGSRPLPADRRISQFPRLLGRRTAREGFLFSLFGQIYSGQFVYTFNADIVGNSGFGQMLSHAEGTEFRVKIVAGNGFALTSNPLSTPTTHYFSRC